MFTVAIATLATLAVAYSRPVEECLPEHPALSYFAARPEALDGPTASRLTGTPVDKLDAALEKSGALLSSDWRLIGRAGAGTPGRYLAMRILPKRPIERVSFTGLEDPIWDKLPGDEVRTRVEVIRDGPWVVNVMTERVDRASGRVVWAETLSHMVGTELFGAPEGPRVIAAIRCPMGPTPQGGKAPEPRWTIKSFDVIITGCEASPIELGFGPLADCSAAYRDRKEIERRAEAYYEFALTEVYRNVERAMMAHRMALALLDARSLAETQAESHQWWYYGLALKRAIDEGKGQRVDVWEGVNAFENAIATNRMGAWGASAHTHLLGTFHRSVAEKATSVDARRRHLDLAIAAFERALKLNDSNEQAKTDLEQAKRARDASK